MKVKKTSRVISSRICAVALIFITVLSSEAGSNYQINKAVITGGGGQTAANTYSLNGAIGQKTTAQSTSASYQLNVGFFQENRDLIFFNEFENNN